MKLVQELDQATAYDYYEYAQMAVDEYMKEHPDYSYRIFEQVWDWNMKAFVSIFDIHGPTEGRFLGYLS